MILAHKRIWQEIWSSLEIIGYHVLFNYGSRERDLC